MNGAVRTPASRRAIVGRAPIRRPLAVREVARRRQDGATRGTRPASRWADARSMRSREARRSRRAERLVTGIGRARTRRGARGGRFSWYPTPRACRVPSAPRAPIARRQAAQRPAVRIAAPPRAQRIRATSGPDASSERRRGLRVEQRRARSNRAVAHAAVPSHDARSAHGRRRTSAGSAACRSVPEPSPRRSGIGSP